MIPPHIISAVRAAPLPALVQEYVTLRRSGQGRLVAQCPFHRERTASFTVYADHYHCFGCGESGNAITFLERIQGVNFAEAVKYLADRAGLRYEDKYVSPTEQARLQREAEICTWWWQRNDAMLQQAVYDALDFAEWAEAMGLDRLPHEEFAACCGRQLMHWRSMSPMERWLVYQKQVTAEERKQWQAEKREDAAFVDAWLGLVKGEYIQP